MRRGLLLAVLSCAACSGPPPVCRVTPRAPAFFDAGILLSSTSPPAHVGQSVTATLRLSIAVDCEGRRVEATSVDATVTDPENEAVMSTTGGVSSSGVAYEAALTFTPARLGLHHVVARFQPNLGLAQFDVLVAVDRSGERVALKFPGSAAACVHFAVTRSRTMLCLDDLSLVHASRDGTVQLLRSSGLWVYGDDVWLTNAGELEHWVDPGSGQLTRVAVVRLPVTVVHDFIPGPSPMLLTGDNFPTVVYRFDLAPDAGFVERRRVEVSRDSFAALCAYRGPLLSCVTGAGELCRDNADGGALDCGAARQLLAGSGSDALWLAPPSGQSVERVEPGAASGPSFPLPLGMAWAAGRAKGDEPRAGSLTLQWDAGVFHDWGDEVFETFGEWVAFRRKDGTVDFKQR